jgi:hypothetical protein
MRRWLVLALAAGLVAACGSPEATRTRGGGQGADVGNRRDVVLMHEGSQPYWATPRLIDAKGQADRPSR